MPEMDCKDGVTKRERWEDACLKDGFSTRTEYGIQRMLILGTNEGCSLVNELCTKSECLTGKEQCCRQYLQTSATKNQGNSHSPTCSSRARICAQPQLHG